MITKPNRLFLCTNLTQTLCLHCQPCVSGGTASYGEILVVPTNFDIDQNLRLGSVLNMAVCLSNYVRI